MEVVVVHGCGGGGGGGRRTRGDEDAGADRWIFFEIIVK